MDLPDRIAADSVANAVWNWCSFRSTALAYGPAGLDAMAAAEEALTAALDAEQEQRADLLGELRHLHLEIVTGVIDPHETERRLAALIARLEGETPAVTHERPDEPGGLTGCCGRTEPRIISEGGVLVDDPGEED